MEKDCVGWSGKGLWRLGWKKIKDSKLKWRTMEDGVWRLGWKRGVQVGWKRGVVFRVEEGCESWGGRGVWKRGVEVGVEEGCGGWGGRGLRRLGWKRRRAG